MRTRSQLIVNVVELLEKPGQRKTLSFSEGVEGLSFDLAQVRPSDELSFDLTLEALDEGILVRGTVSGRYVATCRRCLEESTRDLGFEAAEVYRRPHDAWEEGYVIEGETVDLRRLVDDNVMLNLPLYPLCEQACKGLCPQCGINLNQGGCECSVPSGDLRWQALRQLLEDDQ